MITYGAGFLADNQRRLDEMRALMGDALFETALEMGPAPEPTAEEAAAEDAEEHALANRRRR